MTPALLVENLSYEYPTKRALHDLSVSIEERSVVAMVGPNGAGKTTLLRCLAALEMPFSGTVKVFGHDSAEDPRLAHRYIGYLSDFFGLYSDLTTEQCLTHSGAMQGLSGSTLTTAVDQAIVDLELKDFVKQRAGSLSRGLRQRLAIAQAMIHNPKVLLMDEPASGLDPEARAKLAVLIRRLVSQGMTIVVSSHILAELEDYSTHMLTIEGGRILGYTPIAAAETPLAGRILSIQLADESTTLRELLAAAPGVTVNECTERSANISFAGTKLEQSALLSSLIQSGLHIAAFTEENLSMQEIYLAQLKAKRSAEKSK
ncbi:MAG: ABC transporter ATP-binding protein [Bdellovibrionota bacterium]